MKSSFVGSIPINVNPNLKKSEVFVEPKSPTSSKQLQNFAKVSNSNIESAIKSIKKGLDTPTTSVHTQAKAGITQKVSTNSQQKKLQEDYSKISAKNRPTSVKPSQPKATHDKTSNDRNHTNVRPEVKQITMIATKTQTERSTSRESNIKKQTSPIRASETRSKLASPIMKTRIEITNSPRISVTARKPK